MYKAESDLKRFNQKIRDLRKKGLEKYFTQENVILPKPNGKSIQIPIRTLEIPRFQFGDNGGVGEGEGDIGDIFIPGQPRPGGNQHGTGKGDHSLADLPLEEAADVLAEQLQLPNLLEKFGGAISVKKSKKYTDIHTIGPESLRHFKRTYKRALLRNVASGNYNVEDPKLIPIHEDKRFRFSTEINTPASKAVNFYLLDYSGSMGRVIDFLQNVGWWADAWIKKHHDKVINRYIHYDSFASEVAPQDFYRVEAGGGTSMRAGLSLVQKIARLEYPENEYNLYLTHFTDGDCYGIEFTEEDLKEYKGMLEQYKSYGMEMEEEEVEIGNPLTDFFIPRSSAIFVCEAGAYYGNNNYSRTLKKLIQTNPDLEKKIRVISHNDKDAKDGAKIKETLMHWFK